ALPGIIGSLTATTIAVIGYTAIPGPVGGKGLGDLAIPNGYQSYDNAVMVAPLAARVVIVIAVQALGSALSRAVDHRAAARCPASSPASEGQTHDPVLPPHRSGLPPHHPAGLRRGPRRARPRRLRRRRPRGPDGGGRRDHHPHRRLPGPARPDPPVRPGPPRRGRGPRARDRAVHRLPAPQPGAERRRPRRELLPDPR